ncbi:uncharacterized protein LOC111396987 [Olea europaea var. sylvestris]|uniref:uncharacterized protein LOC111396987 n=1 Tax=Olea europaea var. sylvestris TaxID=158386 RepID=UPI000C1D577F|nr:uncharacterized protein LOC111396987 [Olea europaea var. sylvestris]XP_022879409.1 uncharacterized protein LOC111396987 [Olea europaea var. sylvestris]
MDINLREFSFCVERYREERHINTNQETKMIRVMDEREVSLHSLAIPCRLLRFIVPFGLLRTFAGQRLFADQCQILCDFISVKLAEEAAKPVILGPRLHDKCK